MRTAAFLSVLGLGSGAALVAACGASAPITGAATLSSGFATSCRGAAFDADRADPVCLHHGATVNTPPPSALRVTLVSSPVVRSGYDAGLTLEMKNVTSEPLPVDVEDACGTFAAQASNAATNSFETDCFGVCGGGSDPEPHVLRVVLDPGGVIRKHVKFYAVMTRVVMNDHEECAERTMGALPPGAYDLRVTLPWTDPLPSDPAVTRPRVVESKLTVTP